MTDISNVTPVVTQIANGTRTYTKTETPFSSREETIEKFNNGAMNRYYTEIQDNSKIQYSEQVFSDGTSEFMQTSEDLLGKSEVFGTRDKDLNDTSRVAINYYQNGIPKDYYNDLNGDFNPEYKCEFYENMVLAYEYIDENSDGTPEFEKYYDENGILTKDIDNRNIFEKIDVFLDSFFGEKKDEINEDYFKHLYK